MPRTARKKSQTGIYHVMIRGIDRQKIFHTNYDKYYFIKILKRYKIQFGFELFAYCLMDNHVHILLRESGCSISEVMRSVAGGYAVWFNKKYDRVGHLFQNRFRSEAVEDERYFMTVLRYILYNPVKAGLSKTIQDYLFSSANDYFESNNGITDVQYVFGIWGKDAVRRFLLEEREEASVNRLTGRISNEKAAEIMENVTGISSGDASSLKPDQLSHYVPVLRENGLSMRQISDLTGISIARIRKM